MKSKCRVGEVAAIFISARISSWNKDPWRKNGQQIENGDSNTIDAGKQKG